MIEFTAAQRNAIGLHALDKDACVVAGPGSGKTTVLIERFRALVESGVPLLRILAITFTEKATNQMRERLARAFANRTDLTEAIPKAYVSTVHGFCARLLRENAILAGVDPRFRVLNEQEAFALEQRSAVDALDQFLIDSPAPVRALLRALDTPALAESMIEVYHAMRAAGMRVSDLTEVQPASGARAALDALASFCGQLQPDPHWNAAQKEQLAQVAEWAARIGERQDRPIGVEDFEVLSAFDCNLGRLPRKGSARELLRQLKQELIPAAEAKLAADFYAVQRTTLLDAIARFDALYRERRAAGSALDFSDLEELTVRLLEENPDARAAVRRQFDYILMDEFQDTNGLQARLLDLLRPADRFYAVGDINQSIYGFRYAEPQVFRDWRAHIEAEGKHLAELRENWRSRAEILRAVESFVVVRDGVEPHALVPAKKFRRKQAPSVEVIRCLGDEALEAQWVASRITELQGSLVLDSGATARFGDIAVLVRKADSIAPLTTAFDASGIPYVVTAGKGFFEAREVTDLTHLLRVLANPRDEISLAAVLRSPLAGASDATLLQLKESGWDSTKSASAAVRDFHRELAAWRDARHHVSVDRLLIRAMDRVGYELSLRPRERANVEKFLNLVREAGSRRSLDDLVEELERLRESDPREADSQADDIGDAVRVLTIHAAKGLEFPIVFLPALQARGDNRPPPVLLSPALGLGVRWRNPATGDAAKDSLYEAIADDSKKRQSAESNRLLYVAMTRAEEHLVLSCSGEGKPGQWAGLLESSWRLNLSAPWDGPREQRIDSFTARVICTNVPPAPVPQLSLALEDEAPELVPLPPVSGRYDSTAAVTSIALFADCPRRYYFARYLGWEAERRPLPPDGDSPRDDLDPSEFGRQVHALLAGGAHDGAHSEAIALAGRFQASALAREVEQAEKVEREFDFLLTIDDVVLRGQIDLWFDGSIVDYKTDDVTAVEAPSRAQSYALQLQLYALAVERLTGRLPGRAVLYFLRPDVAVPVDLGPPALAKAAGAVRQFRLAQEKLDFPLHEAPRCVRCPYFRGMCPAVVRE